VGLAATTASVVEVSMMVSLKSPSVQA
jgi:hypothetical protein